MGTTTATFQVIWTLAEGTTIAFKDMTASCLNSAIEAARKLAETAGFIMGQVLTADGRVLATLAPGCIKMAEK